MSSSNTDHPYHFYVIVYIFASTTCYCRQNALTDLLKGTVRRQEYPSSTSFFPSALPPSHPNANLAKEPTNRRTLDPVVGLEGLQPLLLPLDPWSPS